MSEKKIKKDISLFQIIVVFLLGVLIALSAFLSFEYYRLQKLSDNLRTDITTIVQSYNNLVSTLQANGVVGGASESQDNTK